MNNKSKSEPRVIAAQNSKDAARAANVLTGVLLVGLLVVLIISIRGVSGL